MSPADEVAIDALASAVFVRLLNNNHRWQMRHAGTKSYSEKVIQRRWERLPDSARSLLAAFVLHPEPLNSAWLSRLTPAATDVDALAAADWIRETDSSSWILIDPAFREVVTKLTPWSLRQSKHRELAELCRDESAQIALAARHLERVGDFGAAAGVWMEAVAEHALDKESTWLHECLESAQRLVRGEDDPARVDELVRVVERCAVNPDMGEMLISRIEVWLKDARRRRQDYFIGRIAPVLATLLASAGNHVAGAEWRVQAATALGEVGQTVPAARQLSAAAVTYAFALQYSAARETAISAMQLAKESGDAAVQVEALSHAGLLVGMKGETAKGREYLERALDIALKHRLTSAAAEAYRMLGTVAEYASCYGDEQTAFAKALAYCRRHDETTTADLCLGCLSYSLFRSGNWVRSRAVVEEVIGRKNAPFVSKFIAEGVLGLLLAHRGELREAVPLLEDTIRGARQTGILGMEFFGLWGLAMVEEQSGQHAAAALHYRKLLEFWKRTEDRHDAIPGLTSGGLFFADQGDSETASDFATALEQIARETGNPEAVGASAFVAGGLLQQDENFRGAARAFDKALAAFAKRDLVIERIRVLSRAAGVQRAMGNTAKAQDWAREAGRRARRLGARALVGAIENSKPATSEKSVAWGGLSPRQCDVARHLATGLTNKEIAARLGVSVRTVDMHVAHVLQRLDCRTRAEATGRILGLM